MTPETEKQIALLARKLDRLLSAADDMQILQPKWIPLSELAEITGRDRGTLRKHLVAHYRDGRDYKQKSKRGKIYVARPAALEIGRRYDKTS